jgi:hypothetical protein
MDDPLKKLSSQLGLKIAKSFPFTGDFIVLLDPNGASQKHLWDNLLRIDGNGNIVWRQKADHLPNWFVNIEWANEKLVAWTWAGEMITLNPENGSRLQSTFTK